MADDLDFSLDYPDGPLDLSEVFQPPQNPFEDDTTPASPVMAQFQPSFTEWSEYQPTQTTQGTQGTQSTQPPSSEPEVGDEDWKRLTVNMQGRGKPIDLPKHKRMRYLNSAKGGAVMKAIKEELVSENLAYTMESIPETSNECGPSSLQNLSPVQSPPRNDTAPNRVAKLSHELETVPDSEPSSPDPFQVNFSEPLSAMKRDPVQGRWAATGNSSEIIPDSEPLRQPSIADAAESGDGALMTETQDTARGRIHQGTDGGEFSDSTFIGTADGKGGPSNKITEPSMTICSMRLEDEQNDDLEPTSKFCGRDSGRDSAVSSSYRKVQKEHPPPEVAQTPKSRSPVDDGNVRIVGVGGLRTGDRKRKHGLDELSEEPNFKKHRR